jgi:hypothetical protein
MRDANFRDLYASRLISVGADCRWFIILHDLCRYELRDLKDWIVGAYNIP